MSNLNPQITDTMVGIRELRKLTIYPVSLADEFHLTELIATVIAEIASSEQEENLFLLKIINTIKTNIREILTYVIDEDVDTLLKELTNTQASEIAKIIYEANFEESIKNLKDLIKKAKPAKNLLMRS